MAKYIRKTRDEFVVQTYTGPGYGWEDACAETTRTEGWNRLREYRENQPEYAHRMITRRVKLTETGNG